MIIKPIEDNNSDFAKVFIQSTHPDIIPTPHCKDHGSMNKVSNFEAGGYWRCISSVSKGLDNMCRAGCIQIN